MSDEIGPDEAKINVHFAAVREDLAALKRGEQYREFEDAIERVGEYLRHQLPEDTDVDIMALARRAVSAARSLDIRRLSQMKRVGDCGCGCLTCTGQGTHCCGDDCNRRV